MGSLKACAPHLLSHLRLPSLTRKVLIILNLTDEDKEQQPAMGKEGLRSMGARGQAPAAGQHRVLGGGGWKGLLGMAAKA